MKVMFAQKLADIAGSERYLLSILPALADKGIDVSFLMIRSRVANEAHQLFVSRLGEKGIPTYVVETNAPISVPLLWKIREIVRATKIDVLQTNLIHSDIYGSIIKRTLANPPVLVSTKHGYSDTFQASHGFDATRLRRDALSILTRYAARNADAVVSISDGLARLLTEGGLVARDKARVIYYGFDFYDEPSQTAPGSCRFGARQIVSVGRLVAVKQLHVLINAMPGLLRTTPDLKLVLVGAGPLREQLEELARQKGVAEQVVFEGFKPNVLDYIRDSDIFALSSAAEGFGRVILEAWSREKAVVCFDVPAPNEIVTHEEDGLLAPARDEAAFAKALERLLTSPEECAHLGQNGRRTYDTNYRIDVMVDRTIALYHELLDRKKAGQRRA
jgi:glycosyltransferase involved in cell wall biosynthesis